MYELTVKDHFAAAHKLRGYKGSCENLHGHNWNIEVVIHINELNPEGLGIDFRVLRKELKEVLSFLDHQYLNDLSPFKEDNPSSEHIAKYIFFKIKEKLSSNKAVKIKKVTAWEESYAGAAYFE